MKARPFKSLAVASAAAALPMTGGTANAVEQPKADPTQAFAAPMPVWTPQWYFSAEGGAAFANFSRTSFPGGIDPAFGKMGETDRSGSLSPDTNLGWFGALSIGRDIDPIWDWRLTGAFHSFDTNRRSASVDAFISGVFDGSIPFEGTSSRLVKESDRFSFATVDFDMGRKWQQGMLQGRTFAGVRGLATWQNLKISDAEAKGIIADGGGGAFALGASDRSTQTNGQSRFFGLGPRVGIEGFYGTTFGIVGSASAALIPGWRSSSLHQTQKGSDSISFCVDVEGGPSCIGPFTDPFSNAFNAHKTKFTAVGDLTGSLGLGWRPTATTMVEVGYRIEFLANAGESFNFANNGSLGGVHFDQKKNLFVNEPYIKASIRF